MTDTGIFRCASSKPLQHFVADLAAEAEKRGFVIQNRETMAMAETFRAHGSSVPESFDLHMIQICKPQKASTSLATNPERAALMPKFIMAFTKEGTTQVRFLSYGREMITRLVDDDDFPDSLLESFSAIRNMISAAA